MSNTILKVTHKINSPDFIYTNVPHKISGETSYCPLVGSVIVQTVYPEKDLCDNSPKDTVLVVVDAAYTYYIHRGDEAYLINDKGGTISVLHRP